MEGTSELLNTEVRCPNCMEWTYPHLPRAGGEPRRQYVQPELLGQDRLEELIGAGEQVRHRHHHGRRRKRSKPGQALWYVLTDSGPKGPYDNRQILGFAREGKINKANMLRHAGTGADYRAGDIPNLFPSPQKPTKKPQPASPSPASEPQWYVKASKGDAGPFTGEQIVAFAKAGKITAGTMLKKGHAGDYIAAESVRGLLPESK